MISEILIIAGCVVALAGVLFAIHVAAVRERRAWKAKVDMYDRWVGQVIQARREKKEREG